MAVRKFDQNVCELIKKRNSLQHMARSRQIQYESLKKQLMDMEKETQAIVATPNGESAGARKLKEIENHIDQTVIKCSEAEYIKKIYEAVLNKLHQVSNKIECIKYEIRNKNILYKAPNYFLSFYLKKTNLNNL